MKNMFLILTIFFLITGCSDEETKQQENSIYGQWSLIKYEPGFSPTENFNNDEISWTFNSDDSINVAIVNGTQVSDGIPLNTNGNYLYSINNNELVLNNNESFKYEIIHNKLILSTFIGVGSDGIRITFSRAVE